jgi:hypothetical protein
MASAGYLLDALKTDSSLLYTTAPESEEQKCANIFDILRLISGPWLPKVLRTPAEWNQDIYSLF